MIVSDQIWLTRDDETDRQESKGIKLCIKRCENLEVENLCRNREVHDK